MKCIYFDTLLKTVDAANIELPEDDGSRNIVFGELNL